MGAKTYFDLCWAILSTQGLGLAKQDKRSIAHVAPRVPGPTVCTALSERCMCGLFGPKPEPFQEESEEKRQAAEQVRFCLGFEQENLGRKGIKESAHMPWSSR